MAVWESIKPPLDLYHNEGTSMIDRRVGYNVRSKVLANLINAVKIAGRGTNSAFTPKIALHDSSKNSFVRLCDVDSLEGMTNNRPKPGAGHPRGSIDSVSCIYLLLKKMGGPTKTHGV